MNPPDLGSADRESGRAAAGFEQFAKAEGRVGQRLFVVERQVHRFAGRDFDLDRGEGERRITEIDVAEFELGRRGRCAALRGNVDLRSEHRLDCADVQFGEVAATGRLEHDAGVRTLPLIADLDRNPAVRRRPRLPLKVRAAHVRHAKAKAEQVVARGVRNPPGRNADPESRAKLAIILHDRRGAQIVQRQRARARGAERVIARLQRFGGRHSLDHENAHAEHQRRSGRGQPQLPFFAVRFGRTFERGGGH